MTGPALVHRLSLEPNPALVKHARTRAEATQNRVADRISITPSASFPITAQVNSLPAM